MRFAQFYPKRNQKVQNYSQFSSNKKFLRTKVVMFSKAMNVGIILREPCKNQFFTIFVTDVYLNYKHDTTCRNFGRLTLSTCRKQHTHLWRNVERVSQSPMAFGPGLAYFPIFCIRHFASKIAGILHLTEWNTNVGTYFNLNQHFLMRNIKTRTPKVKVPVAVIIHITKFFILLLFCTIVHIL